MKVIAREFTKEILSSTLFVLLGLVALFAFFDLIGQLDNVGRGYTIFKAVLLTFLSLPSRIYEIMPIAVLLAVVYVMSRWAASSEFTALRCAGASPQTLVKMLFLPALILVLSTYVIGEVVVPYAERFAKVVKIEAKSASPILTAKGYLSGVWLRDVNVTASGAKLDRFINVDHLIAGEEKKTGPWRIFEFDEQGHLTTMIRAQSATFVDNEGWHLHDTVMTEYPTIDSRNHQPMSNQIVQFAIEEHLFKSHLGPNLLEVMTAKPENMSVGDLNRYVDHLKVNKQQTEQYEIALWSKAFYPMAIFVMIALAMPFAYLNARSGGMSIKIFGGVMLGIGFYAFNNLFSYLGVLNTWPAIFVAVVPTISMLILATLAMYWVERR